MSLYSSRRGADLPWAAGQEVTVHPTTFNGQAASLVVRDTPQNNPTNPILVARRNNPGENIYWRDLERWPTESEKEHARKVLTRLAALKKSFQEGNTPDETTFSE